MGTCDWCGGDNPRGYETKKADRDYCCQKCVSESIAADANPNYMVGLDDEILDISHHHD